MTLEDKREQALAYLKKTGKGLLMVKHTRERFQQMQRALQPEPPKAAKVRAIR